MKQVTMESVKQRIADLESAGKVVGGLSLSSEFELACLRELVAVTEQRDALVVENVALNEKMDKLATWPGIEFYSSAWEFTNSDGNEALECMCDTQTPATSSAIASLRAEGVEMFGGWLRNSADIFDKNYRPDWADQDRVAADKAEEFARQLRDGDNN